MFVASLPRANHSNEVHEEDTNDGPTTMSSQRISSFSFFSVLFSRMLSFSILIKHMQLAIISHAHHEGSYIDLPREREWRSSHGDPLLDNCRTTSSSSKTWSWLNIWCFDDRTPYIYISLVIWAQYQCVRCPTQDSSNNQQEGVFSTCTFNSID